jgi:LPS sulfotransferase NodH
MKNRFDYFVIFAGMRTGSNFLEENLNEYPGVRCYGEAFNPSFIGAPNREELLGFTLARREADPLALIARMREETDGLAGFRFFSDHDPRVFAHCLADRRCAKIILSRNPLDSFISLEIARQTGQWRLGDMRQARSARIRFDEERFRNHLAEWQAFQADIRRGLQISGQTGFYIGYEDIADLEVLNGMARFLGIAHEKTAISRKTKKQNPQPLEERVENFAQMEEALARADVFNLSQIPNHEPRRGAMVPGHVAAARAPVLFMPVRSGPVEAVRQWLAALDGASPDDLQTGFTRKSLRKWKRQHKGHRSFTVLRHPVARLHHAFVEHILNTGPESYPTIRTLLRERYEVPLPEGAPDSGYDLQTHRRAFIAFARFVRGNLSGQTSIRVDGAWASQSEVIRGFAEFSTPDHIFREEELADDLAQLAGRFGLKPPALPAVPEKGPHRLEQIYDEEVESAVKAAYQRDYMAFGFGPWKRG